MHFNQEIHINILKPERKLYLENIGNQKWQAKMQSKSMEDGYFHMGLISFII
jgi:hypothetical protein